MGRGFASSALAMIASQSGVERSAAGDHPLGYESTCDPF